MTIRLPFLLTRCASPARRFRSNSLALIEVAPVPDLIHDDRPAFDTKTEAVVAGPQPIPAGEVAGEGLGPADGGPTLQPPQTAYRAAGESRAGAGPTAAAPPASTRLWPLIEYRGRVKTCQGERRDG